jgi:hypothetical protein
MQINDLCFAPSWSSLTCSALEKPPFCQALLRAADGVIVVDRILQIRLCTSHQHAGKKQLLCQWWAKRVDGLCLAAAK